VCVCRDVPHKYRVLLIIKYVQYGRRKIRKKCVCVYTCVRSTLPWHVQLSHLNRLLLYRHDVGVG
jgi:hypothetical protein